MEITIHNDLEDTNWSITTIILHLEKTMGYYCPVTKKPLRMLKQCILGLKSKLAGLVAFI